MTKKYANLICSIIALFCFVSMFMPIIAPRYPAGEYYPSSENYVNMYFYTGDYYYAREYWSISRYVFSSRSIPLRVLLSISEALLLYWALYSVRGEAGKMGLVAAIMNLAVTILITAMMLRVMGSCRWGVLVVLALDAVAAVAMAAGTK